MSQGGEKYPTKSKKKEGLLDSSYLTQELSFKAYYWKTDRGKDRTGKRGIRRKQLLDYLKEKREYWELKEETPDRTWKLTF